MVINILTFLYLIPLLYVIYNHNYHLTMPFYAILFYLLAILLASRYK